MSARSPHFAVHSMVSAAPCAALFVVLAAWISPSQAQETAVAPVPVIAAPVVTEPEVALDELIRLALANNPQLPIARETVEAARQRVGSSRAQGNPTLQVTPRLLGSRTVADEEIILSQPLDLFGRRRARSGIADAQLRAAEAQSTLAERSLVVAVKNSAADLFAAQEAESLGTVQVEVAQLFRDAAARRAELGDVPPVQVQRADLELLRVQNELTNAETERLARRATLNQLIGQAPETPLRVALPLESGLIDLLRVRPGPLRPGTAQSTLSPEARTSQPPLPNLGEGAPSLRGGGEGQTPIVAGSSQVGSDLVGLRSQLLPGALQRPDIVGAQATLEARRAQIGVLRSERRPEFEIQARRGTVTGSGSTALRAVVIVPLFDFGSNKRERSALEAEVRAQEAQIALLRSQAATQVEQALLRLQQQRQTVERYRRPVTGIVAQTLDLLRKTQIGYAQGASTYLEVLEAQRTLRQVQTEYLQALVGTRTQEAALEGALGATPSSEILGALSNPTGPMAPPGTAAPGTIPQGTIPLLQRPPLAAPSSTVPVTPTVPTAPNAPVKPGAGGN